MTFVIISAKESQIFSVQVQKISSGTKFVRYDCET